MLALRELLVKEVSNPYHFSFVQTGSSTGSYKASILLPDLEEAETLPQEARKRTNSAGR